MSFELGNLNFRMPASATRASADAGSNKFRMPAEWEPHTATWLAWPTNKETWPGRSLKEVQSIHLAMIAALLPGERVELLVQDKKTAAVVLSSLVGENVPLKNLKFHQAKTADAWIRDYGPIFVLTSQSSRLKPRKAFVKWAFNGWGNKYPDLVRDNGVVDRLEALKKMRRFDPGMVLEGGSIDVNGRGICLTTEQCLLNPNRNPRLSRPEIESYLGKYLGVKKTIWLKKGIEGDDTDGHVDDLARFAAPGTVLIAVEGNKNGPNHAALEENRRILIAERDLNGKKFKVVELPMPSPPAIKARHQSVGGSAGDFWRTSAGLPASYANFYIGNGVVLVPIYSHRNDKQALKIIQRSFAKRKVLGIECSALVHGRGSIHCVTQQEPT